MDIILVAFASAAALYVIFRSSWHWSVGVAVFVAWAGMPLFNLARIPSRARQLETSAHGPIQPQ